MKNITKNISYIKEEIKLIFIAIKSTIEKIDQLKDECDFDTTQDKKKP